MGILNSVLKTFVGDKNKKDLAKILPLVKEINAKQQAMEPLSADELRAITGKLKTGIQDARKEVDAQIEEQHQLLAQLSNMEEKEAVYNTIDQLEEEAYEHTQTYLNQILPEAFGLIKETARRFATQSTISVTASPFDRDLAKGCRPCAKSRRGPWDHPQGSSVGSPFRRWFCWPVPRCPGQNIRPIR